MREVLFGSCLALIMAIGASSVAAWPVAGRPVAALFSSEPGSRHAITAIAKADGALIGVIGSTSWVISVSSDSAYASSLYRQGAWLVIDARMAILCFGDKAENAI